MNLAEATQLILQRANNAYALGSTLKFDFEGETVYINGMGECNEVSNTNMDADCTLHMTLGNFEKLINGELNPMMAVLMGQIKIKGDMGVAMKLQSLIA